MLRVKKKYSPFLKNKNKLHGMVICQILGFFSFRFGEHCRIFGFGQIFGQEYPLKPPSAAH
jgi:hypothetical protein